MKLETKTGIFDSFTTLAKSVLARFIICSLLLAVAGLATMAKNGQYFPETSAAHYVSISTKMNVAHPPEMCIRDRAQALVHDPDVIILDEPTVGLDPKQIIEVRHLIKGLAGNHTIILSTHILPEVSMTCDRVVIINKGKIAAVDTPQNLTSQLKGGQKIHIETEAPEQLLRDVLSQIPGASRVVIGPARAGIRQTVTVEAAQGNDIRSQVAAKIVEHGWPLYELHGVSLSLEDIFLELTTDDAAHAQSSG